MLAVPRFRRPFHHPANPARRAKSAHQHAKIVRGRAGEAELGGGGSKCRERCRHHGVQGTRKGNRGGRQAASPVAVRPSGLGTNTDAPLGANTDAPDARAVSGTPVPHVVDIEDWLSPLLSVRPAPDVRYQVPGHDRQTHLPDCGCRPNRHDRPRPSRADLRRAEA